MTDKGIVNVLPDAAPNLTKLVTLRNFGSRFCETFVDGFCLYLFPGLMTHPLKKKSG